MSPEGPETPGGREAASGRVGGRACCAVALRTAATVGVVLTIINRPEIFTGRATAGTWAQVGLNFLVPFLVATYSRWRLLRQLARPQGG